MFLPVFVCLSVCLLARFLKNVCMDLVKCYMTTDVGTWTNLSRSGLQSRCRNRIAFFDSAATWNFASGKFHVYVLAARCCSEAWFSNVLFTEPSEHLCRRYMRSTECPSSFLFVDLCWKISFATCVEAWAAIDVHGVQPKLVIQHASGAKLYRLGLPKLTINLPINR